MLSYVTSAVVESWDLIAQFNAVRLPNSGSSNSHRTSAKRPVNQNRIGARVRFAFGENVVGILYLRELHSSHQRTYYARQMIRESLTHAGNT
jgi:hypothetical protein